MNYNNRLLLTHLRKQSRQIKTILNISSNNYEFPDTYRVYHINTHIHRKNIVQLVNEISDYEFDFVYCQHPVHIFGMTHAAYSTISRLAFGGLIHNVSPISAIMNNMQMDHLTWTNSLNMQNTLCMAEYKPKKLAAGVQIKEWDRICLHKPYYLHDWYAWNYPEEFMVRLYLENADYKTGDEYVKLVNSAIEQSAQNTANIIEVKKNKTA